MAEIGIIVVTYNSATVIGRCLDAALRTGADIVVVDNASTDATRAEVERRGVRLITNATNRGFAAAVNQGFRVVHSSYVLLLNPDCIVTTSLDSLRKACDLPGVAGAGGMLLDAKGSPQIGFMVRKLPTPATLAMEVLVLNRVWSGNPWNRTYRCLGMDYNVLQPVQQPAGALLMIRRAVWEELGGFEEHFWPLWFEDVDFCRRALDHGYCFMYEPAVVAIHTGAHSIIPLSVEMRRIYWYRSLLSYSVRHFRPPGRRAVCLAVIIGALFRAPFEAACEWSLRPLAAYWNVARLASACLLAAVADVLDRFG